MSKRQETEAFILENINELIPNSPNTEIYKKLFASMDDTQFDQFMKDLESGKSKLAIVTPNFSKYKIDLKRNFALAKKLGHNFFQRVWIPAKENSRAYLTPIPYLVVDLPLRRQAQLLSKKISIPEDNNSVDDFTGQPTGKSKGSKISYPEVQVMAAMGLDNCLTEFLKYRGGDEKGFNAMNTIIDRTGSVSMKQLEQYASGVKSTQTLRLFFLAMHILPKGL